MSVFMERRQPETNTFHFPFGEMSIILVYVVRLLKILVVGKPVAVEPLSKSEAIKLVSRCLEVSKKEVEMVIGPQRGINVKKKLVEV
ncbi:hypothetical protein Syun_003994 [Stephania yunnanensis]|uniref:Aminotransferase-like plant mobile domain-containing protein n=1 Tax=Stephania yunnanensis TaxID=152371 RepID=A0AAP0L262_9MAGN